MLSSLAVCYAVMQLDLPQRKPGPLFKIVFLKDPSYFIFTLGKMAVLSCPIDPWLVRCASLFTDLDTAFAFMISSVYVPFFCIQSYAVKLQIDEGMAFYLLAITNVASLFGRLFPNWLADRYNPSPSNLSPNKNKKC